MRSVELGSFLKGIIFDLDGVLTDTSRYHYLAWKSIADNLGIPFDVKINERLKGVDRMASLEIILEKSTAGYSQKDKLRITEAKNNYYLGLINSISPADLYPGVKRLFEEIKANEIRTALGSASKNAAVIIKRLGIEHYFDEIVDANLINKSKPDPEIFIRAADMIGLKHFECAVVEDSAAGIRAAGSAGMLAVGIGKKENLPGANLIYPCIADLKPSDLELYASTAQNRYVYGLAD